MTKERELLRRAYNYIGETYGYSHSIALDIRAYLDTEKEAEPYTQSLYPELTPRAEQKFGYAIQLNDGSWVVEFSNDEANGAQEVGRTVIPLYTRPEPEAEPVSEEIGKALIEMHTNYVATPKVVYQIELNEKAMNADLVAALRFSISKYFDDAYVYGDELLAEVLEDIKNHQPKPEPARKPITYEQVEEELEIHKYRDMPEYVNGFLSGISFAEQHHGVGGDDE